MKAAKEWVTDVFARKMFKRELDDEEVNKHEE